MTVIIVGGGPVGLTTSIALSAMGASNAVIEKDHSVFSLPRAIVMDPEVRHTLMRFGHRSQLEPVLQPMVAADFVDGSGTKIMGIDLQGVLLFGCPAVSKHFQPMLDRALRDIAVSQGAELVLGRSVTAVESSSSAAQVTLDDGTTRLGSFIVACDGASSGVRKSIGVPLTDLGFDQEWLVVDLLLHDRESAGLPDITRQVCDKHRPTTLVSGFGNYYRFEFQMQPGETREDMVTEESVWRLLAPWIGRNQATVVRKAAYRFHAVVAQTMNRGRVLLAGDAAHQMPPFMGQGLNSGMRDAFNLAWKLAYVVRGWSNSRLLESYSDERIPLTMHVVEQSVETGRLIDQLAGRVSHGVSEQAGYGGRRRSARYEHGVIVGDHPNVGAIYAQWHHIVARGALSFHVISRRHRGDIKLGLVPIEHHEVDDAMRYGADHVVIRPDGYVAAVCSDEELDQQVTQIGEKLCLRA